MTTPDRSRLAEVLKSIRPLPPDKLNILKTLLAVQSALGYVPTTAISQIAQVLGVTDAQVAGALSYYPDLRIHSTGRHLIRVCMGESCLANRSGLVLRAIQDHPCVSVRDNEHEKRFALEQMSCAGNCALSPTVIVDDAVHGRVVPSQVAVLLERYK